MWPSRRPASTLLGGVNRGTRVKTMTRMSGVRSDLQTLFALES